MAYEFTVSGRIAKPVHEVFEAVADPGELSAYFTTGGAKGRLETGATVSWDFHDFPGAFPVHVVEVVPDSRIVLRWDAAPDDDAAGTYQTTVTMTFEGLDDGRTLVRIHEGGFRESDAGRKASFGNCEGWTGMLCAMRVWKEHGIRFREGFYK
ncbi:MAG: SRPBCC domain-containing protein [Devosia sp.]|uniref:SRPBCC domain-containing protein n=1 Tax=Devosia sp. TaxID=1871048 RepID=UPI0024C7CA26|nr:SRPBCC domain-containing protein [Devosia sp.]UYO01087.1 MAG: SRPBCC domain-containing protein [Devosia sp.]